MPRTPAILLLLAAATIRAQAIGFVATNLYRVAAGETVAGERWVVAGAIACEGDFRNDLFAASGETLRLGGIFRGDVWGCAGLDAVMDGACARNLRLAAKTIRIDGPVAGNVMALADTIILGTNAVVSGDARLVGASVIHEGAIAGNASISAARMATLAGTVGGNVRATAPDIVLQRGARIGGDLAYAANKEIIPEEGVVGGVLQRIEPVAGPLFSRARLASKSMWFLAALLAGVPFIALFPMTTAMASQLVRTAPWKCLWVGFLAATALPILGVMCASSLVGLPLGALVLASWGMLAYTGRIVAGLVAGSLMLRFRGTSPARVFAALALGLAAIYLAALFPPIGLPVHLAAAWLGTGALILALLQKRRLIIQVPENLRHLEALKNQPNQPKE